MAYDSLVLYKGIKNITEGLEEKGGLKPLAAWWRNSNLLTNRYFEFISLIEVVSNTNSRKCGEACGSMCQLCSLFFPLAILNEPVE